MSFDFLRSASTSSSAFRVVCGEMVLDDRWNVHSEVAIALVRTGSMTLETTTNAYSLRQAISTLFLPIRSTESLKITMLLLMLYFLIFSNPASVTQEYIPQSLIRGLTTGNCTHFAKVTPEDAFMLKCLTI